MSKIFVHVIKYANLQLYRAFATLTVDGNILPGIFVNTDS